LSPDPPWLPDAALPSLLTGADDLLPHWLRTPEGFDAQLARVDRTTIDALAAKRHANLELSAEVFFASGTELNQNGLGIHQPVPGAGPIDPEDPESGPPNRVV